MISQLARPTTRAALRSVATRSIVSVSAASASPSSEHQITRTASFALGSQGSPIALSSRTFFSFFGSSKSAETSTALAKPTLSESEVQSLFGLWNDALATLDPDTVAKRYAKESVLLPTVSDVPRTSFGSIKEYFVDFLKKKPQGVILESTVFQGDKWCMDAGIYEFTMGATGDKVKARYSYVYTFEDGEWKIAHHHSSVMPEAYLAAASAPAVPAMSESDVRGLFSLWNNALATLDPDTVAKRYASTSILLPTVSDIPRTDYASIKSYFVDFLQKKPQGVILESTVIQGDTWSMDAGIYEFTMGATGDKVKARYTYVYVFEDGEWKIAHHHSSVMPEAFL